MVKTAQRSPTSTSTGPSSVPTTSRSSTHRRRAPAAAPWTRASGERDTGQRKRNSAVGRAEILLPCCSTQMRACCVPPCALLPPPPFSFRYSVQYSTIIASLCLTCIFVKKPQASKKPGPPRHVMTCRVVLRSCVADDGCLFWGASQHVEGKRRREGQGERGMDGCVDVWMTRPTIGRGTRHDWGGAARKGEETADGVRSLFCRNQIAFGRSWRQW